MIEERVRPRSRREATNGYGVAVHSRPDMVRLALPFPPSDVSSWMSDLSRAHRDTGRASSISPMTVSAGGR